MEGGGGQTKQNVSGWTTDTLHAHIASLLAERDRFWIMLLDERDKRYEQRFESHRNASREALTASQTAINKAEAAVERRLENTNEWRDAMNDRDVRLLSRDVHETTLKEWGIWRVSVDQRLTEINTRSVTWTAALGAFFIIVQFLMMWLLRKAQM